jgi:dolichyl-phosphate-mannose-protein mannosyltransferase
MRGISYWENKDGWKQIYVLGNPFMWWFIIVSIGIFLGLYLVDLLLMRRGMDEFTPATRKWWLRTSGFLLAAWGFHYFPFFLMGRQLFLHHYLPAYIFSTMIVACLWDFIFRVSFVTFVSSEKHWNASRLGTKSLWIFVSVLLVVFTWSFFYFSPLSYGTGFGSLEQLESRKWFKSWDIQHARK